MSQKSPADSGKDEWREVPVHENNPRHWVLDIEKPNFSNRQYRFIRLENGIQILLIQDSGTDMAGVAMSVGVGYLSDPDDMQGMAHLCEHAILMGDSGIWDFVRSMGGTVNAFTVESNTCYYLSIGREHLNRALECFSQGFMKPNFDTNFVNRKLSIVNSEFIEGEQSDPNRLYQVFKTNALPKHSWRNFPAGNRESLSNDGNDEERSARLQKWWEEHYSASIMGLVILGRESLDDLTGMAFRFQHIPPVPDTPITPETPSSLPTEKALPWGEEQQMRITFVKSILAIPTVEVTFCLPSHDQHYESKPVAYISRLITHEGPGSLHTFLRKTCLIKGLSIESSTSARGFSFFGIKVSLAYDGFMCYEKVVRAIYTYLGFLSREPSSKLEPSFEDFKTIENNRFHFSQNESVEAHVCRLSEHMLLPLWPRRRLLKAATGVWRRDDNIIRTVLQQWLEPRASSITLVSNSFPADIDIKGPWSRERWYGTEYTRQELPQGLLEPIDWQPVLPGRNEYIPQSFETEVKSREAPILLNDTKSFELWFRQGDQFSLPKCYIGIYLRIPALDLPPYERARNAVMTKLVERILTDALIEKFNDAFVAGLQFSLVYTQEGNIAIQLGGFTHRILLLLENLLSEVENFIIEEDVFLLYIGKLRRGLENAQLAEPSIIARQLMERGLVGNTCTDMERKNAFGEITLDRVRAHLKTLFSPEKTTVLVTGNINSQGAFQVQEMVERILKNKCEGSGVTRTSVNVVPTGINWVYTHELQNIEEKNNSVRYYLQIIDDSRDDDHTQANLLLQAHIIREPFFRALRTKQKLGYAVSSAPWVQQAIIGMLFMVQSNQSTVAIENEIEEFLTDFEKTLTSTDFQSQQKALVWRLRERPQNLDQESVRFAFTLLSGRRDFNRRERIADKVEALKQADITSFYRDFILPPPPSATFSPLASPLPNTSTAPTAFHSDIQERCLWRKVSIHVVLGHVVSGSTNKRRPYRHVEDLRQFRDGWPPTSDIISK